MMYTNIQMSLNLLSILGNSKVSVFEKRITYLLENVFPSKGRGALEGIACYIA